LEPGGTETDSNDSPKNAVFGIVVSNTGKKGARTVEGVGEFTTSTHSSFDRFFRSIIVSYCPFGPARSAEQSFLVHRSPLRVAPFSYSYAGLVASNHGSMACHLTLRFLELLRLRRCSFPVSRLRTTGNAVVLYLYHGATRYMVLAGRCGGSIISPSWNNRAVVRGR